MTTAAKSSQLNKKKIKVSEITGTGQGDTPAGTGEAEEKKEAAGS